MRFQYITNSIFTGPGFALDDFAVESEAGVQELQDFEAETDRWSAAGFVYASDSVRQGWSVFMVTEGDNPQVWPLKLDDHNRGEIDLPADPKRKRAIWVIAATAPFTLEPAIYSYQAILSP